MNIEIKVTPELLELLKKRNELMFEPASDDWLERTNKVHRQIVGEAFGGIEHKILNPELYA